MSKTNKPRWLARLSLLIVLAVLLSLISTPRQAHADWPPFRFQLLPSYENGKILYSVRFSSEVDWEITDLTLKFPLPQGTRFLEAEAEPTIQVSYDGAEITFFTAVGGQSIRDAYFVLEVTDPTKTTFSTYAWIAWKGKEPGEYVSETEVVDITLRPLNWMPPARSRVQLEAGGTVVDDIITYTIYPVSITNQRIWDLKVDVPIPQGTTFLSAEAPPSFVTSFDGRQVSFSSVELEARTYVGPLQVKVSSQGVESPYVSTYASVSWKNVGRNVGRSIPLQEKIKSGDIIVQPHAAQQVISDIVGDVPFSNYDLAGLALGHDGTNLEIIFYSSGEVGPAGEPLEYTLYIDTDCRADTGFEKRGVGAEFRVRYRHNTGKTYFHARDEANEGWDAIKSADVRSTLRGNQVIIWVPDTALGQGQRFCWSADAANRTREFISSLPVDAVPDNKGSKISKFELVLGQSALALSPEASAAYDSTETGDITRGGNSNPSTTSLTVTNSVADVNNLMVALVAQPGQDQLHAYSALTGEWATLAGNDVNVRPDDMTLVRKLQVLVAQPGQDQLHAFSALTGEWATLAGSDVKVSPDDIVKANDSVIVVAQPGQDQLHAYSALTGEWATLAGSDIKVASDDRILVGVEE